jgi:hypothetical protein
LVILKPGVGWVVESGGTNQPDKIMLKTPPWNSQLVMTLTPRSCYNLERNQRFNSPYESGSLSNLLREEPKENNREGTVHGIYRQ